MNVQKPLFDYISPDRDYEIKKGDCLTVLKKIEDGKFDLILTSPPYNVDKGEVFPLDIFYYQIFKKQGLQLRNRIIWYFGHGLHASNRFSGRYETILWFSKTGDYIFNLDNVRVPSKYPGKRHFKGPKKGQISGNPLGKNPSDIWEIIEQDWDKGMWNLAN